MGNGTVIDNIGTGLYRVRLDYDTDTVDAELARIEAEEAAAAEVIAAATISVAQALDQRDAARAGLDAVLAQWQAGLISKGHEEPGPIPADSGGPPPSAEDLAGALADALAAVRVLAGVPAVTRSAALDAAAGAILEAMGNADELYDPQSPGNRAAQAGYGYDATVGVGLALAAGVTEAARATEAMPRRTLIDADYTEAGYAYAYRPHSRYSYLWGVLLAAPGPVSTVVEVPADPAREQAAAETRTLDRVAVPSPAGEEPDKLKAAVAALGKAAAAYNAAKRELDRLYLERAERQRRSAQLQAQKAASEVPVYAWAAQYDVQYQSGDPVPLAEVSGWRDRTETAATTEIDGMAVDYTEVAVNILPVGSAQRGRLRHAAVMSAEEVFVNLALEPGHIKWNPRWRYGTISRVAGAYCDVDFVPTDARTAHGLGSDLNIDYAAWWPYVPILYPCLDVFEVGDEVLVDYEGQDLQYPVVVGFRREPRQCIIPSGLLYWNALAPTYPLRITVGDVLRRYRPPLVPGQDYMLSRVWTDTRPDIEYPDLYSDYYVDRNFWPSMWSGLARLAIQACHSILRDPREIFGSNIDHLRQGIVRDTAYRYWRVSITAAGIRAAKLTLPSDQLDEPPGLALETLQAHEYTDERDRHVLEARVLAYLEPAAEVEIASAAEIAPVLAEGFAMSYGWKFARGALQASMVTFREECMPEFVEITCIGQFVCSLYTVDFVTADVDGVRQMTDATIALVDGPTRSRPRTAWTSIYRPTYGANYAWDYEGVVPGWGENPQPACCYSAIGETVQPLYCYYDTSDVLQVAWYIQYQLLSESHDTRGATEVCTTPYYRAGEYGSFGWQIGGFHVGPTKPDKEPFRDGYYDYTVEDYTIALESLSDTIYEQDRPTTSDVNFVDSTALWCSGGDLYDWYQERSPYSSDPPFPKVGYVDMWAHLGYQTEELNIQTFSADPRAWSLVVAALDAEAVYVLATSKEVVVGPQKRSTFAGSTFDGGTRQIFGGVIDYKFYATGGGGLMREESFSDLRRNLTTPYYQFGGWYGYVQNLASRTTMDTIVAGSNTVTPPSYVLHTPHGGLALPEDGYWPTLFPESVLEGMFIDGQPVAVCLSYAGDGLRSLDETDDEIVGGYSGPELPGIEALFIGGA